MGLAYNGRVVSEDYYALIQAKFAVIEQALGALTADTTSKNTSLEQRLGDFNTSLNNQFKSLKSKIDNDIAAQLNAIETKVTNNHNLVTTRIDNTSQRLEGLITETDTNLTNKFKEIDAREKADVRNLTTNLGTAKAELTALTEANKVKIDGLISKFQFGGRQANDRNVLVWFDYETDPAEPVIKFRKGDAFVAFGADWK